MKVHLDLRTSGGPLFCGTVEAESTVAALIAALAGCEELQRKPFANLSAQARPSQRLGAPVAGLRELLQQHQPEGGRAA